MNSDPIPVRLTPELLAKVDRVCKELTLSRSAVLRLALKQWLEAVDVLELNPLILREGLPQKGAQKGGKEGAPATKKQKVSYPAKPPRGSAAKGKPKKNS